MTTKGRITRAKPPEKSWRTSLPAVLPRKRASGIVDAMPTMTPSMPTSRSSTSSSLPVIRLAPPRAARPGRPSPDSSLPYGSAATSSMVHVTDKTTYPARAHVGQSARNPTSNHRTAPFARLRGRAVARTQGGVVRRPREARHRSATHGASPQTRACAIPWAQGHMTRSRRTSPQTSGR